MYEAISADHTDVQYTEIGPTCGAGDSAGQPGIRSLLILAAGEPSTQTGQTPHWSAETLLAVCLGVSSYNIHKSQSQHNSHGHAQTHTHTP